MREALFDEGYVLSDRQFKIALWNNLQLARHSKAGRRTQEDRGAFTADEEALRGIVQQQVRRSNENGPKLITEDQAQ